MPRIKESNKKRKERKINMKTKAEIARGRNYFFLKEQKTKKGIEMNEKKDRNKVKLMKA